MKYILILSLLLIGCSSGEDALKKCMEKHSYDNCAYMMR